MTQWELVPTGTEGYAKAEVTVGGVDTRGLSSQTMAAKSQPGLYFIGEVMDVTGWLGGYNFQWAWASAHACAQALKAQQVQRAAQAGAGADAKAHAHMRANSQGHSQANLHARSDAAS